MDWSDERYVRIYVRDTKTWKLLGWEGQTVLCLLARRFDRAGLLDDVRDGEDVALMIGSGFPVDVAERGLQRLIDKGVMRVVESGLFWPKFLEAQESRQSDKQRQRESRAKRRAKASLADRNIVTGIDLEMTGDFTPEQAHSMVTTAILNGDLVREDCEQCGSSRHIEAHHDDYSRPLHVKWLCKSCHKKAHVSQNVTKTNENVTQQPVASPTVTPCCTVPSRTVPSCANGESAHERASKQKQKKRRTVLPDNWEPTPEHKAIAIEQGVDLVSQAEMFRDHWKGNGEVKADWDATFRNWLRRARDFSRGRQAPAKGNPHQRTIDFLQRKMEN